MARALIALPSRDFDVTEVATPWHRLTAAGHTVMFATPDGQPGACDPLLLTGVLFGQLGAEAEPKARYARMIETPAFAAPLRYDAVDAAAFDALVLPGGHAPGMRPYLEDGTLQGVVRAFLALDRPIAAICHGVLVLARTTDPATGRSVLHGRRVTCLLDVLERLAYYVTAWKLGRYYRTYDEYVEAEVRRHLASPADFQAGPAPWLPFVCVDGRLVTARWPLDAEVFADALLAAL